MRDTLRVRSLVWLLALGSAAGAAYAQDAASADAQVVPAAVQASQRAARLTFVAGEVHVQRQDNTGEDGAVLNMPLREGTRLLTGADGRAEIEFEDGSLARLAPGSGLSLDSLVLAGENAKTRMSLLNGLAYFELRAANQFAYMVQAGALEMTPVENVSVRVKLAGEAPPQVAVLSGTLRVESPDQFHVDVRAGESLRIDASDPARYFLDQTYPQEDWDWWNEERDQAASDEAAKATVARAAYAGPQGYGWSDMDANGSWYDVPGLGLVWQPDSADDSFDPYGYGDWVYDSGGYTFVSGYAWGWTPFHCGRWAWSGGFGWGWTPGAECGRWGFGGRRPLQFGGTPGHYPRPQPPSLGGPVHRIVIVRGPSGARPPLLSHGAPVLFGGHRLEALAPIGKPFTPHGGSAAGRALLRDFPLNHAQPMLGAEPGTGRSVASPLPGWHEGKPIQGSAVGSSTERRERTAEPSYGPGREPPRTPTAAKPSPGTPSKAPAPVLPPTSPGPSPTHSEPVHPPAPQPIQQPTRSISEPHHYEPAPVRSAPAPQTPPSAPAHTDTAKPK